MAPTLNYFLFLLAGIACGESYLQEDPILGPIYTTRKPSDRSSRYRVKRQLEFEVGYHRSDHILLTFMNKAKRRVMVYQAIHYAHYVVNRFLLRPNEPRTISYYPDGTIWTCKDYVTKKVALLNGRDEYTASIKDVGRMVEVEIKTKDNLRPELRPLPKGVKLTMEVIAVAEASMVKHHGMDKVEKFLVTMMNNVARAYVHKSLGISINVVVVDIIIWKKNPKGFTIEPRRPDKNVELGCRTARKMSKKNSDLVLIVTRAQLGAAGYAAMYTMCTTRSCAIIKETGLGSSYVAAHEIGHALGLHHDKPEDRCNSYDYGGGIMARRVYSTHANYHWSYCTKDQLKQNIVYFKCLQDQPDSVYSNFKESMKRLPGEQYSLSEQCKIYHDSKATSCTRRAFGVCKYLWCSTQYRPCQPLFYRSPLEGSPCEKPGMWCMRGSCTKSERPIPTDGNWSDWSIYSPTCKKPDTLMQSRNRSCNNPSPKHGGAVCKGSSQTFRWCKGIQREPFGSFAKKICSQSSTDGKTWDRFDWKTAANQVASLNLKCDFEKDLCGWRSHKDSVKEWLMLSGKTPSSRTGPSFDHTLKTINGTYIYYEASWTKRSQKMMPGDQAILESKGQVLSPSVCLRFAYHMYGRSIKQLEVKIQTESGGVKVVWKRSGDQGDKWETANVTIHNSNAYKILFYATRGSHFDSDFALDDIDVTTGTCANTEESAKEECTVACSDKLTEMIDVKIPNGGPCRTHTNSDQLCWDGRCQVLGKDGSLRPIL